MSREQMRKQDRLYQQQYDQIMQQHDTRRFQVNAAYDARNLHYVKVCGIEVKTGEQRALAMREQMRKVFTSMWSIQRMFALLVRFDGAAVEFYVGTDAAMPNALSQLQHVLESTVTGVTFQERQRDFSQLYDRRFRCMGMFAGNPVVRELRTDLEERTAWDEILSGTAAVPWMFCLTAQPIPHARTLDNYHRWLEAATESSEYICANYNADSGDGLRESMGTKQTYAGAEIFHDHAISHCAEAQEALQCGQWGVTMTCYARTEAELHLFGGLLTAQMRAGQEGFVRPLPFRFYPYTPSGEITPFYQVGTHAAVSHLSSHELTALCALPVEDTLGFYVRDHAAFDVSCSSKGRLKVGNICSGGRVTQASYRIDPDALNRHGLVIGLTGGGKTNTVKSLLYTACKTAEGFLPFMMMEPAKKEYYELYRMGITDLQVYSVGGQSGNIYKLNPFECIDGVPLQSHIDAVFAAFKASFILYTPMPYILETAIYAIYEDYGWDVETGQNRFGSRRFPTIEDLYYKIPHVVRRMGYDDKMRNDLTGSLSARINSLRVGAKGRTLNVGKSLPMQKLLEGHVVIELDDVGDEDAKAFIMSLLFLQVQECRKAEEATHQKTLQHLLLVEEAHRLLKNIPAGSGEQADPRGAAVEYFCNMLAELRSKGQGFLVIDQIPSKLAPDLVKNTNLKIIHRTVAEEDRQLVGGAMHMTAEQKEYLACLEQGVAAVYAEGDNRPKLVKLPYAGDFERQAGLQDLSRAEILRRSAAHCVPARGTDYENLSKCSPVCAHCRKEGCDRKFASFWGLFPPQERRAKQQEVWALKSERAVYAWFEQTFPPEQQFGECTREEARNCLLAAFLKYKQFSYSLMSDVLTKWYHI